MVPMPGGAVIAFTVWLTVVRLAVSGRIAVAGQLWLGLGTSWFEPNSATVPFSFREFCDPARDAFPQSLSPMHTLLL